MKELEFMSYAVARIVPGSELNQASHSRIKEHVTAMRRQEKLKNAAVTKSEADKYCGRCHHSNDAKQGNHGTTS